MTILKINTTFNNVKLSDIITGTFSDVKNKQMSGMTFEVILNQIAFTMFNGMGYKRQLSYRDFSRGVVHGNLIQKDKFDSIL